ncbi:prepilin-type N-terminal cleavage/methylation domain-containing protein [Gallaecimonas sp. GXIMD4217]|uniref:prepilin-type N-terminal cleavage/methylation domain-containing protein n=1 Tax=Gallaecimonas sp. GXIMD4217 TaxID=3131927 RepID=UPI00311B31B9
MKPNSRGMTLVELLVAMTLGLVVILAATTLFSATVGASSVSAKMSQLRNDLNAISGLIASDLRRAGYDGDALSALARAACSSNYETDCPFAFKASRDINAAQNCIVVRFDADGDGNRDIDSDEIRGYRLNGNQIQVATSWGASPENGCDNASTWEAISYDGEVIINGLTFTYVSGAAGTNIRSIDIAISGAHATAPDLQMAISRTVRLRNDDI